MKKEISMHSQIQEIERRAKESDYKAQREAALREIGEQLANLFIEMRRANISFPTKH